MWCCCSARCGRCGTCSASAWTCTRACARSPTRRSQVRRSTRSSPSAWYVNEGSASCDPQRVQQHMVLPAVQPHVPCGKQHQQQDLQEDLPLCASLHCLDTCAFVGGCSCGSSSAILKRRGQCCRLPRLHTKYSNTRGLPLQQPSLLLSPSGCGCAAVSQSLQ